MTVTPPQRLQSTTPHFSHLCAHGSPPLLSTQPASRPPLSPHPCRGRPLLSARRRLQDSMQHLQGVGLLLLPVLVIQAIQPAVLLLSVLVPL